MSMEMHVFFRGKLPAKTAINRTLKELGLPLAITDATRPLEQHTGFMPMKWRGEETGVEFDVWSDPASVREIGAQGVDVSFDRTANFRWGGDMVEMLSAQALAAALAKLTGGVVYEADGGSLLTLDDAVGAARATLQELTAGDKPKERTTRKADLKHFLKPLLKERPDLILRDRFLFITPVRHVLRGVLLERCSDIYSLGIKTVYGGLCARLEASPKAVRWMEVRESYFQSLLFDVLQNEALDKIGEVTSLSAYANKLALDRASPIYEPRLLAQLLAGEPERAEELVDEAEANENFPRNWIENARSFIRRDIESICAESHAREARIAASWELGDAWLPTPFPVEVPVAERRARTDDLKFQTVPWPRRPDNLLAEMPEYPSETRFACGHEWRGDRLVLLSSLTREQAQALHENHKPYCMCTWLAAGVLLLLTRGERPPFWVPKGGKLTDRYTVLVRDSARTIHAGMRATYEPELLELSSLGINRKRPGKTWSAFNFLGAQDDSSHIEVTERESGEPGGTPHVRELPMTGTALAACHGQVPEFGDYSTLFALMNRYSNFLGYGDVINEGPL